MKALAVIVALAAASVAHALPPDAHEKMEPGQTRFLKVAGGLHAESSAPEVATAEAFSTDEVLVEAKGKGTAFVYVFQRDRLWVARVEVGAAAAPGVKKEPPRPAQCKFSEENVVEVTTPECRRAMLPYLEEPRALEFVFDHPALTDQLKDFADALAAAGLGHVTLRYAGAVLELSGTKDDAELHRALKTIFPRACGPILFERRS